MVVIIKDIIHIEHLENILTLSKHLNVFIIPHILHILYSIEWISVDMKMALKILYKKHCIIESTLRNESLFTELVRNSLES